MWVSRKRYEELLTDAALLPLHHEQLTALAARIDELKLAVAAERARAEAAIDELLRARANAAPISAEAREERKQMRDVSAFDDLFETEDEEQVERDRARIQQEGPSGLYQEMLDEQNG